MTRLAGIPGRKVVRAFERAGFVASKPEGSHVTLRKPSFPILSFPSIGKWRRFFSDHKLSVPDLQNSSSLSCFNWPETQAVGFRVVFKKYFKTVWPTRANSTYEPQ